MYELDDEQHPSCNVQRFSLFGSSARSSTAAVLPPADYRTSYGMYDTAHSSGVVVVAPETLQSPWSLLGLA